MSCFFLSSSHSTKLTEDVGSLQSVCAASSHRGQPGPTNGNNNNNNSFPSYSHLSTAAYSKSLDEEQDGTLTAEEATQYLELSPKPERCRWSRGGGGCWMQRSKHVFVLGQIVTICRICLVQTIVTAASWPCPCFLPTVSYLSRVLPCPTPSPPLWAICAGHYAPLSWRMTLTLMSPRLHQLACDTPASRAHLPPATASGTAHCGTPGAQSQTETWPAPAPASSAQWTAVTPPTALTLPGCWLWQQRPWVEPLCQVGAGETLLIADWAAKSDTIIFTKQCFWLELRIFRWQ